MSGQVEGLQLAHWQVTGMNIDDIPTHYLSRDQLPPDDGMTSLEWAAYLLIAASAAGFGLFMLLETACML